MSGHSKWANIKHRKGKQDSQRAKIFTKIGKEIIIAAKQGGGDPEVNARLKVVIQKARGVNMPMDNINRTIQKATGELAGVNYEEITYEGYGPGGTAVMLDILTDNRNRTAGDIRHLFSKFGGNLGEAGCVAWMFKKQGVMTIDKEGLGKDHDEIMMIALDAGAEDMTEEEETFEITCAMEDFETVEAAVREAGLNPSVAEVTMVPENTVALEGDDAVKMLKLMDALEDHDDVQDVYANFDIDDEVLNNQ
ncbi:MAG: YebC/PmpR family DNA-binding transcriptional regulator [Firmicutes bacterium HGW-Firmicutes-8]|nr:MAG: YebC/PmpR family DNA-binding transcriptional regulator [Firmicutes bacterium HGW-Firmicutes-8]